MKTSILGDIRAEADREMLGTAFLETADFKTLINNTDRPIVVGRRGTGKSALAYHLIEHWRTVSRTSVVLITPTEDQVIGLRTLIPKFFGDDYKMIRAGTRIAWRYALLAEIACLLVGHYRIGRAPDIALIKQHAREWTALGTDTSMRLRKKLINTGSNPDAGEFIAEISRLLEVSLLHNAIVGALNELKHTVVLLIDRVDEGYEPDNIGVAMVDGLVLASIDINTRLEQVRLTLFLRDNMARAVEQLDPDYSRDIEGQVLRLHWEEAQLLSLVCKRLRRAFSLDFESDIKVWNRCATRGLAQRDGFKQCLRSTLYRPRDILSLLNEAFVVAARDGRTEIIETDVDATVKTISRIRLQDLHKEYSVILPGLERFTSAFKAGPSQMSVMNCQARLEDISEGVDSEAEAQTFALFNSASDVGQALYSIGFFGTQDPSSKIFAFCHDGRMLDRTLRAADKIMVHPCYWMALDIADSELEPTMAEEIFDDCDIRVFSQTPDIRKQKLGQLIGELDRMKPGDESASDFEDWCLRVIKIIFAAQLSNVEHHPNGAAVQRRDVVATNLSKGDFWQRLVQDYQVRQVIFEVKNYAELGPDEYRQIASYLVDRYGRLGFVVTRANNENLTSGVELTWVRELSNKKKILVIKLTGKFFSRILSKMRSPQRHDEADSQLNKLLDRYERLYLGEPSKPRPRKKGRVRRSRNS